MPLYGLPERLNQIPKTNVRMKTIPGVMNFESISKRMNCAPKAGSSATFVLDEAAIRGASAGS
jgi:hypothetical protein